MGSIVTWFIILIIGAMGSFVAVKRWLFEKMVKREVLAMWSESTAVAQDRIDISSTLSSPDFPPPVRRYLANAIQRSVSIRTLRLSHRGTMRTSPSSKWIPVQGQQYFSARPPAFIWWGRVPIVPGFWIDVMDSFRKGRGRMLVTAASTWTMTDAQGPELSESALLRLLGEIFWFPTAFLDRSYVRWQAVDDKTARAHIEIDGLKTEALFHFDPEGQFLKVTGLRYRNVEGRNVLTPWTGISSDFREVDGVKVPFKMEAIWNLPEGDFPCIRFEIETIEYNVDKPFP